jgi:glycerol-3-phosphate dehydrogenase
MNEFSHLTRASSFDELGHEQFDLLIIGGGITGAGAARDAASRGMKVALVEAQDFAQGTSSRSSKLIHGGIRYLENLEFGLVFEALSERRLLFEIAPHLVHPLRFVLPLYQNARVGMFKMGLGMWLYDALSMFEAPEMHERLDSTETMARIPLLQSQKLKGSYVYSDAYMDDDRLVIETLRSAHRLGAKSLSYVKALGSKFENAKVVAVEVEDQITHKKVLVRAKHFISTTGPWTDIVAPQIVKGWKKILRPSKGVHLTFRRDRIPISQAVVMVDGKRIVFAIPRHEMVIIGTTDTDFDKDPSEVTTTAEDVAYLLKIAAEYFPGAKLKESDIVASYAGVRPLVDDGSETESKTSREHLIVEDPQNVTFVAGGKYTTYRLMAEQTVEAALKTFSLEDQVRFRNSQTKVALNPKATPEKLDEIECRISEIAKANRLSQNIAEILFFRHGEEAFDILKKFKAAGPSISGEAEKNFLWSLEARHAIHETMCMHLTDFYTRRSPLFLSVADHGLSLLPTISKIFAEELGWSDEKTLEECRGLQQFIERELAWRARK